MNRNILVPIAVLVISFAFLDPFMVLMPTTVVYILLSVFFLAYIGFALLVWNETVSDEREYAHRAFSSRMAYIAGTTTLVIGIFYQVLVDHIVDPWLPVVLSAMVIAKYIGLYIAEKNN